MAGYGGYRDGGKLWALIAFAGGVYAFLIYEMWRVFTTGEVYARHLGWVTYAEHPAAFVFYVSISGAVLIGMPPLAVWLWSTRRGAEKNLRALDQRRLLDQGRRQTMNGEDV